VAFRVNTTSPFALSGVGDMGNRVAAARVWVAVAVGVAEGLTTVSVAVDVSEKTAPVVVTVGVSEGMTSTGAVEITAVGVVVSVAVGVGGSCLAGELTPLPGTEN